MTTSLHTHFPLSVSFHTIERAQTADSARLLAGSAAKYVELWEPTFDKTAIEATSRAFSDAGVSVRTVHAEFGADLDLSSPDVATREAGMDAYARALELTVQMNGQIVVVHPSAEPIEDDDRADRIRIAQESINILSEKASDAGKAVAVELLPRTCLGRTAYELLELVDRVDSAVCGICLDTNHLMGDYAALSDVVRLTGPRLLALHCSDYDGVDEKHWPPLQGVIDWSAFLFALKDIGFSGPFNYEAKLSGVTPAEKIAFLETNYGEVCSTLPSDEG